LEVPKEGFKSPELERELVVLNSYPCKLSIVLLIAVSVLFLLHPKLRYIASFGILYATLIYFSKKNALSYEYVISLLSRGKFQKLNLNRKPIFSLCFKLSFDSAIVAPIDVIKSEKSVILKLLAVLGLLVSLLILPLMIVYAYLELTFLRLVSKREKAVVLFSKELYYKSTRTPWNFDYKLCGIPGLLIVPKDVPS